MKLGHSTKKGTGRFHIHNLTIANTRNDKLNDDGDKKLSAAQKQANKYARRYGSNDDRKSKFIGFRKVRQWIELLNMSVWVKA